MNLELKQEPIQYNTHLFKYYDKDGKLLRARPGRECSSKESAESVADEAVEDIEKCNIATGECIRWNRKDFIFGKNVNNNKKEN